MNSYPRFLQPADNSFFLFGPRGSGKTLWLRRTFPDALFLDLLSPAVARTLSAEPDRLRELLLAKPAATVVIDEVQKVPELLDVVHGLMVDFPEIRFVLTGSSARKLARRNVNLLGGRAETLTMHPFLAAELGDAFDGERALKFGLLPLILGKSRPAAALRGYVGNYLAEEVRAEGLVRNVGSFARFLEAASFSHGSIPNARAIAAECGVSQPTAATYFDILRDLLLAFSVPAFTRRARRELSTREKFYFCDVGLFQTVRPRGILSADGDSVRGVALEGLVAQQLRAWCDYSPGGHRLHHWRTAGGVEVDFVVHGENFFGAFEVKSSEVIRDSHLRGLRTFAKDYPEAKLYLLHGGSESRKIGDILCLPWPDFLRSLRPFPIGSDEAHLSGSHPV
jgi:predicted AAA+ superfamily ATPase